jgi:hypothetical protein
MASPVKEAPASTDAGKGETTRTTTQDARSVNARNSPGNIKLWSRALKLQFPRTKKMWNRTTEKNPISKTHQPNQPPKKVRQTCAAPSNLKSQMIKQTI